MIFILGFICGIAFMTFLMWHKTETHNLVDRKWVERSDNAPVTNS